MDETTFQSLVKRVRQGDAAAAEQLVAEYEPALRRQIRMCLTDPWVKRVVDSSDVVQSVLGNFFIRLAAGQFELESPSQLVRLLGTIALNKIRNYTRDEHTDKRRSDSFSVAKMPHGPSEIVANKELLEKVQELLSDEERAIVQCRVAGLTWQQVAEQLQGAPEALRKQHARALNRVALELELDELDV